MHRRWSEGGTMTHDLEAEIEKLFEKDLCALRGSPMGWRQISKVASRTH